MVIDPSLKPVRWVEPNEQEHLVKAQLVYKIDGLMKARGLKQVAAAKLLGVKQPDVSKMLRRDFRQFSVERLLRFLVALGQDVEIVVKPHRGTRTAPQLRLADEAAFQRLERQEKELRARIRGFRVGDRLSRQAIHERRR